MTAPKRTEQLAHGVRDAVGAYLTKNVEFPADTFVTVTRAVIAPGSGAATVYVSILPHSRTAQVLAVLERELYHLQGAVNRAIPRRPVPRIRLAVERALLSDAT